MRRALVLILGMPLTVAAHDMWLVTGIEGAQGKLCARIGESFPGTVNAPAADRVSRFQLHGESGAQKLEGELAEKQFCATLPEGSAGVAEIVVHPRLNQLDAARFQQFVKMEGLEHIVAKGNSPTVKYLYSRYSKALIGKSGRMQTKALGHVLEIVPRTEPASWKPGGTITVQVLFEGKPLPNAQIAAVHEGASAEAGKYPVVARTNENGLAELRLIKGGLWYARLIHTIPAKDPEFDWHHFFTTLTFRAGGS